jgi:hypothetical protein
MRNAREAGRKESRGREFKTAWLAPVAFLLLLGCAPTLQIDDSNRHQTVADFMNGNIELGSAFTSFGAFERSKQMHGLYAVGDWQGLSRLVIEINSDSNLNWFYLGRSAEELGFPDAAGRYYTRALSTVYTCSRTLDECDGFIFPQAIYERVNRLNAAARRKKQ